MKLKEFDITVLADNGLRRGRTTGTCAAAAAKAAAMLLERGEEVGAVEIALPDGEHYINVPILRVFWETEDVVRADVIKVAGDDPDATDGAIIFCVLNRNGLESLRFLGGEGVGIVIEEGIRVPVGEPAINPVPRQMIKQALTDVVGEDITFDVIIGCERGAEIAKKTFNPRLGIKGGISILGTTGIVEPLSMAAYIASIEVYVKVALAGKAHTIALMPGNIGLGFAGKYLELPKKRIVHISNYLGLSLDFVEQTLRESSSRLPELWLLGHPGKIAKLLDNHWDTHSRASSMAMSAVGRFAKDHGRNDKLVGLIADANTVEETIKIIAEHGDSVLWQLLENHLAKLVHSKLTLVDNVHVKLFDMRGQQLFNADQHVEVKV